MMVSGSKNYHMPESPESESLKYLEKNIQTCSFSEPLDWHRCLKFSQKHGRLILVQVYITEGPVCKMVLRQWVLNHRKTWENINKYFSAEQLFCYALNVYEELLLRPLLSLFKWQPQGKNWFSIKK